MLLMEVFPRIVRMQGRYDDGGSSAAVVVPSLLVTCDARLTGLELVGWNYCAA
ncbi:hypothetical protein [Arthrobacter sp. 24S4-2]|uniref:hypothetical protein n=1 Tax=Arthrobacter sp. 24S4-2 TaxID=2575374 RepID=UPI0015869DFE|nr:hypothetical protein [Arthrobacter sp. 24S4-2]